MGFIEFGSRALAFRALEGLYEAIYRFRRGTRVVFSSSSVAIIARTVARRKV